MVFVGSAYSYLQEWLPHVGQHNVREGLCDFVGLGRIVLSYPDLPADVLAGAPLQRARSAARSATAPPARAWAWCPAAIPLDPFYVKHPAHEKLKELKGTA